MSALGNPPWYKPTAYLYARMLATLNGPDCRETILRMVKDALGDFPNVAYFPKDRDMPAMVYGNLGTEAFVLIDGCRSRSQFVACADGYRSVFLGQTEELYNPFVAVVAEAVNRNVLSIGTAGRLTAVIAGYSLGGAVAHYLGRSGMFPNIAPESRFCVSYGAPKAAQQADNDQMLAGAVHTRWFTPGDPIPLLPPSCSACLGLAIASGTKSCAKFDRFRHVCDGCQINPNGSVTARMLPSDANVDSCASLAGFMQDWFSARPSPHDLANYVAYLISDVGVGGVGGGDEPEPVQRQAPAVVTPVAELQRAERAGNALLVNLERTQNDVPVSIPKPRAVYALKTGGVWTIYFGDVAIAVRPNKKAAKSLARDLQSFLERLQKAAVVDPGALVQTLQDYLQAATDPNGGFEPVMNTSFR